MSGPERIWIDGAMGGRYLTASEDREDCLAPHGPYVRADLAAPAAPTYDRRVKEYEEAYQYALALANALHKKHYAETTEWRPLGDLVGLLTQIDNMVAGFVRGELISGAPPNGGPAYPVMWEYADNETGMSLRDWFAGQALAGGIVNGDWDSSIKWRAQCAYEVADAMIAARDSK